MFAVAIANAYKTWKKLFDSYSVLIVDRQTCLLSLRRLTGESESAPQGERWLVRVVTSPDAESESLFDD
jgi:hypothetical protein